MSRVEHSAPVTRLLDLLEADAPAFARLKGRPPTWLWLWVPIVFYVLVIGSLLVSDEFHFWVVNDERGLGENLTTLFFLGAGICAFLIYRYRALFAGHPLKWTFPVVAVVAIFVAGEEASWGQHFFGWGTPEWMAELNKQDETNLHNMAERALDQKPRAVISILIFLTGVVLPLLIRRGKLAFLTNYPVVNWLMPTTALIPAALLTFLPRLPDRIQANIDVSLGPMFNMPTRHYQEIQEFYIGLFIFLYLLTLLLRLKRPN